MAISRPRVAILSRSESASRFTREPAAPFAPASHASPRTLAPGGSNPINASASMDFPLPDSPTSPSDSPVSSVNDTSSTGRIHPAGVGSSTVRPRSSMSAVIQFPGGLQVQPAPVFPAGCKYSPHPYIIRRILRGLAKTASSVGMLYTEWWMSHAEGDSYHLDCNAMEIRAGVTCDQRMHFQIS